MNDSAISKAIAHTHFAIVAAIAFCLVVITLLYLTFSSGLTVKKLKLGGILVEQLYIKWDNALAVRVGSLTLAGGASEDGADLKTWHERLARLLGHADASWIGSVTVNALRSGDMNASFVYRPRGESVWTLHAKDYDAAGTLSYVQGKRGFLLEADANLTDVNTTVYAEGYIDLPGADIYLSGDVNVSNRVFLAAGVHAADDAVRLNVYSTDWFDSVAPLVLPMHLDSDIRQWIVDRAQGGPLMLHALRTTLPYDAPAKAFDALYGHVTFKNVRYAFANDPAAFEPAVAGKVDIVFRDKKLDIVPEEATFYGQSGGSTWLDIDFSGPHTVLDLYLRTTAALTPPLHRLIQSYGINLPFVQTEGLTDANLTLHVNLDGHDTNANGQFRIQKGAVDFSGLPMTLETAVIRVANADITINSLRAALFDGNVTAEVTGAFNPAIPRGNLHFSVLKARYGFGQSSLRLAPDRPPLEFDYRLAPAQDRLLFAASQWRLDEHNISVAAFDAPFDYGSLTLSLPKTAVALDDTARALLSGRIDLGAPAADLDLDLTRLQAGTFRSAQEHTRFHVVADHNLTIETNATSRWTADETPVSVGSLSVARRGSALYLAPTTVTVTNQVSGTVEGTLELATLSAELNVTRFRFEDEALEKLFESGESFSVYVVPLDNEYDVIVPSLNMLYSTRENGWKLHFFSLEGLKNRSPLLDEYNLTQSTLTVRSEDGGLPVDFTGSIDYPYALTLYKNKPVSEYHFSGRYDENGSVAFTVNDTIRVAIDGNISVRTNDIAYNLPELTRFYLDHHFEGDANATEAHQSVFIDANNTAIVFTDGRKAKADKIAVQYENDAIHSQLFKGRGGAMLDVKGENFYLYGKDLDDDFMEHFFKFSKFKGGNLDFYVIGDKNDFKGLVKIDGTTVYDYVLLNNLFAFINTVPALVTFSLPSYETEGIRIASAYAELQYHEGNLTVSGIKVDSKEMDFTGHGLIDYTADHIKMELTVKTSAGENIRKIPLVGYILVGDKSVFTTVNITGPVEDPRISSTIAKDIIVTPFNVLKRAFNFPVHYLEQLGSSGGDDTESAPEKKQITSGTPPIN